MSAIYLQESSQQKFPSPIYNFFRHFTETPKYDVVRKSESGYEVRKYHPQIRASVTYKGTSVQDTRGFRSLAGYIFGGNSTSKGESESVAMTGPVVMTTSESIAMTGPVVMETSAADTVTMSFVMPSKYTSVSSLPTPHNASVKLTEVPSKTMAVIPFSWSMNSTTAKEREEHLRKLCSQDGVPLATDPSVVEYNQYNPPWTLPFCRTNEVSIPVQESSSEPLPPSPTTKD
jgi:hypothetical protein